MGIEVARLEIRKAADIGPTMERRAFRAQALYAISEPLLTANRIRINTLALLLTIFGRLGAQSVTKSAFSKLWSAPPTRSTIARTESETLGAILKEHSQGHRGPATSYPVS